MSAGQEKKAEANPFLAALAASSAEEEVEIWPENWPAVRLMIQMQTQWLFSPGGVAGLNYLVLFALMDRMSLTQAEYSDLFADVQALESYTLESIRRGDD